MGCLFCKIAQKKIPATIIWEDESILAFRDINPQAPKHVLIIPKIHIKSISSIEPDHSILLGNMIQAAKNIAKQENLVDGYRLIFNVDAAGGQEIYHIHLHLIGGRPLQWPPG